MSDEPAGGKSAGSEARYRALFENPVLGIRVSSVADGARIVEANAAYQRMLGYSEAELAELTLFDLTHPEDRDRNRELYDELAAGKRRSYQIEKRFLRKDGSVFWGRLTAHAIVAADGEVTHHIGLVEDISDRQRLEAEIRQAQKMEAVGRLAGGVAHDFNTLLGTIRGYSEMLLSALPREDILRRHAEQIHRAALRGAQLTRQLLLFSRRQEVQARAVDLAELLGELDVMLDRLLAEDVRLTRRIEPGLGQVWGDPGELHQVILNLVVNACDAMPFGGTLALSLQGLAAAREIPVEGGRLPPGAYVVLEVADSGTGMDEEVKKRIFEPFFTTKGPGEGTGLGLSTVHAIVRRSRGGIAVESRPGEGTTFRIYLPRAAEPGHVEVAPYVEPLPAPAASATGAGRTILLAEDDEMFRGLLSQVLAAQGYRVLAAANPAAARELAAAHGDAIDLLLSDMIMPGGTGADLAEDVHREHPAMKVVLMSGYTDDALASRRAARDTADAFLEKPFATQELLGILHGLLAL